MDPNKFSVFKLNTPAALMSVDAGSECDVVCVMKYSLIEFHRHSIQLGSTNHATPHVH